MAGRKPKIIPNPFLVLDDEGVVLGNLLEDMSSVDLDNRIEDILIGAVGTFKAHTDDRNEYVNWKSMFYAYQQLHEVTRQNVQDLLGISIAQAKRYAQVMNLASKLINNHYIENRTSNRGYVHLTQSQLNNGYMELL